MSDIRELRLTTSLRPNLDNREAVQESFQEVLNDLSNIKQQWNDNIYPLLGSLPGGRVLRSRADRNNSVDPTYNGFDGSQVYMDMASRPNELSGLLHNGTRPKTIKEVVLDSHHSLFARLGRVEDLLNDVNADNAAYDDTELRKWLIQLAGETWDPDQIAIGETFNTNNFAGAPAKSTVSLASRILNMRHLIGVEASALTLKDISGLFAGTNYISADTDVVKALKTLDTQIASIVLGDINVSLQDAYDEGRTIDQTVLGEPIQIIGSATSSNTLKLKGGILFDDTVDDLLLPLLGITTDHTGVYPEGTFDFKLHLGGGGAAESDHLEFFKTSATYDSGTSSVTEAILTLGKTEDDDDVQYFRMLLGRETTADGGEPHLTIRSVEIGGNDVALIQSPLSMYLSSTGGKVDIESETTIDVSAGTNLILGSTNDTTITATDSLVAAAGDDSSILVTGGTLKLGSTDERTTLFGTPMWIGSGSSIRFGVEDASSGLSFDEYTTVDENGLSFIGLNIFSTGKISLSNDKFSTVNGSVNKGAMTSGSFSMIGYAPNTKNGVAYGNAGLLNAGGPDPYTLYRDNVIKAKGVVLVWTGDTTVAVGTKDVQNPFNIALDDINNNSTWNAATATLNVVFLTELDDAHYSVSTTIEEEQNVICYISNKTTTGFSIVLRLFVAEGDHPSGPNFIPWDNIVASSSSAKINFQVV